MIVKITLNVWLVGCAITLSHLVTGVGSFCCKSTSKTHFHSCMLRSGKCYQPVSEMSEVADLLKTWMAESRKQEQRHEEERLCYQQERAKEKRHYEQERAKERQRYEDLVKGLTERRP